MEDRKGVIKPLTGGCISMVLSVITTGLFIWLEFVYGDAKIIDPNMTPGLKFFFLCFIYPATLLGMLFLWYLFYCVVLGLLSIGIKSLLAEQKG